MTMPITKPSALRIWLLTPGLFAFYITVTWLSGQLFASYGLNPPPVWLSPAITVAALWHFGRAAWPGIFLGSLAAHLIVPAAGASLIAALGLAIGESAGGLAGNRILDANPGAVLPFRRMRHLGRFFAGPVLILPLAAASTAVLMAALTTGKADAALLLFWLKWLLADATGILLLAPVLMLALRPAADSRGLTPESAGALAATTLLSIGIYWFANGDTYAVYALPYMIALPLAWAALRFELHIAVAILLASLTIALSGTLHGAGALNATGDRHPLDTLALIMLATSIGVYSVNTMMTELLYHYRAQRQANQFLSAQVAERTEKLAASEARFRSYFNAGLIGLGEIAPDGRWVLVNNHLRYLLGFTLKELVRMPFIEVIHAADRAVNQERFNNLCAGRIETYTVEVRLTLKNGRTIPALFSARAARKPEGELDFVFVVIDDITRHKTLEAELKRQATIDYLTGLSNRRHFTELAAKEIERAQRRATATSFLVFDLDHFKAINDNHGHPAGDAVLKKVAIVCLESLRSFDVIGRVGGEEFAVLLPDTDLEDAIEIAERLRRMIADVHRTSDRLPAFTVSIGVALRQRRETLESLFSRADEALYRAKQGGRNRVEVAPGEV